MAGLPWISVDSDFWCHPKAVSLCARLRNPLAWAHMVRLWGWCAQVCQNGHVEGEAAGAVLEFAAGWTGEPGEFLAAVLACRLVDAEGSGYRIHGWLERAGAHIEKRRKDAERQARHRQNTDTKRDRPRDVTRTAPRVTGGEGDGEVEGERREETRNLCAEPEEAPAPAPAPLALIPPEPTSPVVAVMPCVGKGPKEYAVTEAKVREWQEAYPGVDVMAEVRQLVQWARDTPKKRKTYAGAAAFFSRNLAKKQDRNPNPRQQREQPSAHDIELRRALASAESDYRSGKYARPTDDPGGCGAGGPGRSGESDPAANDVAAVGTSLSAAIGAAVVPRR